MSHNINFNALRGSYSFVSRKEKAWHGLGQVVDYALTSEEAIRLANMDFNVEKRPCFIRPNPNDTAFTQEVPNTFALMRTDLNIVLNKSGKTVTDSYHVVQNVEAFEFFDNIVGSKEAIFETAGVLGLGEKIFITAKLPKNIKIKGSSDEIEQYLLLSSSHDGAGAIEVLFTPIRVVCNNTLTLALKKRSNKVSIRHTKSAKDKLLQSQQVMGIYKAYEHEFIQVIDFLATQPMVEEQVIETTAKLVFNNNEVELFKKADWKLYKVDEISVRKKNIFDGLLTGVDSGVGQDQYRGTKLWMLNGVSTYLNNIKDYKGEEKKFEYIISGGGQRLMQSTLDLLLIQ